MKISNNDATTTHFLNVDLQIRSKGDLQPLVSALGDRVLVLYAERYKRTYYAYFETKKITKDADATILAFCPLIRALPRAARQLGLTAKARLQHRHTVSRSADFLRLRARRRNSERGLRARRTNCLHGVFARDPHNRRAYSN